MDTNNYRYDPLDPSKRSLRLLRLRRGTGPEIECELIPTTLDDELRYEAVSYTWGPNFKVATVNVNGKRLPINFNLNLILQDLRSLEIDRLLWVDAICIDQSNAVEKGHQVQQMRDVFSSAARVLFCISRSTALTDFFMHSLGRLQEKLQRLDSHCNSAEACWKETQLELANGHLGSVPEQIEALTLLQRQALGYILTQDWFKRVWIVQEVANAQDALVYCGSKHVLATVFVTGTKLLGRTSDEQISSNINSVQEILDLMPGPLRSYSGGENSQDLYSILRQFRNTKATDERNKIFALFGLCSDTQVNDFPKVDYTISTMELIRDTISYICHCDPRNQVHFPYDTLNHESKPLHWAAEAGHNAIVGLLLERGANIEVADSVRRRPLHCVVASGEEATARLLLEAGAWVDSTDHWSRTPLHYAAVNREEAIIRLLFERGAGIESTEDERRTPLHLAAKYGNKVATRLLLERGANIYAENRFRETPLYLAAASGHEDTARLLIEAGARLQDGWQASLGVAAENGHEAVVELLIQSGAHVETKDKSGRTPLYKAAQSGHEAVVKLLIRNGANVQARSGANLEATDDRGIDDRGSGRTPLHTATEYGHEAVVKLFIQNGANIETADHDGQRPLYKAAQYGYGAIVQLFIQSGVDVGARNPQGKTAMDRANEVAHREIGLLLETAAENLYWNS
ncbi:ankyrin repeat-containing domain protein [Nemania sp. FL0916]|nr:ankyrin repeat-containing domain protein [Nemania sp. FL0916]